MSDQRQIVAQLLVLLILVLIFSLIGQGVSYLILKLGGLDFGPSMFIDLDSVGKRQMTRLALMSAHLISFFVAAVVFLYIFHRDDFGKFLQINGLPDTAFLFLSFFLLLVSYPIVGKLGELNMNLPLPDWMTSSADAAKELLEGILVMDGFAELFVSVVLIGALPAIGEELLYRGIVQTKLQKVLNNDHLGILCASLLFSLNHFQFDRFLPFAFLGLVLGYAYYYTRNLWVPVLLHFLNNSVQVFVIYHMADDFESIDFSEMPDIPNAFLFVSIFATMGLFFLLKSHSDKVHYVTRHKL